MRRGGANDEWPLTGPRATSRCSRLSSCRASKCDGAEADDLLAGADTPARFGEQRAVHVPDVFGTADPSLRASSGHRRTGPATARSVRAPGVRPRSGSSAVGREDAGRLVQGQYAHLVLRAPRSRVTASLGPARARHILARAPKRGADDAEDAVRGVAGRLEQQSDLDGAASKVGSRW